MGLYLDENCEETLVDSFSVQSYYISHDVGVRVSVHRGGFPFARPFLAGRGGRLNLTGELQVSYLVDFLRLRVLDMPLLIPPCLMSSLRPLVLIVLWVLWVTSEQWSDPVGAQ